MPSRRLTADYLESLYARYNRRSFWTTDPVEFLYRYSDPLDQELVACLSAVLAYGNVRQIRRSVEDLLARLTGLVGRQPSRVYAYIGEPTRERRLRSALHSFKHRFNVGDDIFYLIQGLASFVREHGSLRASFANVHDRDAETIEASLSRWIENLRARAGAPGRSSFHYLLTSPSDGSCCKRWCMFMRWMGRRDDVDPGLWMDVVSSRQLVLPLDTHTGRICLHYGMTRLKSLNWKAALQATRALRRFNAEDPVRFDFALSRLGIVEKKTRELKR